MAYVTTEHYTRLWNDFMTPKGNPEQTCPDCKGLRHIHEIVPDKDGSANLVYCCSTCNGTGKITKKGGKEMGYSSETDTNDSLYKVDLTLEEFQKIKGTYEVKTICPNCADEKTFKVPKGLLYGELNATETLCDKCEAAYYSN